MADFAFVTGIARSGTNLVGRMLGQHPAFAMAMDPMLPVLKWFRSAAAKDIDPSAPLHDYYFFEEQQRLMAAVQQAGFATPFDTRRWPALQKDLEARAVHESADLVPHLGELKAGNFAAIWQAGLDLVAKKRGRGKPRWAGVKELWSIEFVPHFFQTWPSSKTVLIVRDPRAIVASMLKMGENDRTQQAQILSYLRHWRKTAAFALTLRAQPERFTVVRYEELVAQPEKAARELCRFFGVEFDRAMLETSEFSDPSRGGKWQGNSSYDAAVASIDAGLAERWRSYLPASHAALIDYVCGPDMRLFGYRTDGDQLPPVAALPAATFLDVYGTPASWRTDSGDALVDMGLEVARRALLEAPQRPAADLVRRCFLFESAFEALRT